MSKLWCFTVMIVFLFSCMAKERLDALPFYDSADLTPRWQGQRDSEHIISAFSLVNQEGDSIKNQDVLGKIYVANFFFTTCGSICPRMMHNLKKVQETFSGDTSVLLLSHTVLPEKDSVAVLKRYAEKKGINSRQWWLLTGEKEQVYNLARRSYFADEETGYFRSKDEFLHTENCMLIDGKGRIRGVYNATLELEINKLISHIEILQASGD
jgi:protein SCO1/2